MEALRARLRGMGDRELLRFGKSAGYMCSPEANLGKAPRQVFIIQLREAKKRMAAASAALISGMPQRAAD